MHYHRIISPFIDGNTVSLRVEAYTNTINGKVKVNEGDWIIKGVMGEYYPCNKTIFQQVYERVEE